MAKDHKLRFGEPSPLLLDYGAAATPLLLNNLSCAASVGDRLWTVADEGRTLECLRRHGDGFALEVQYRVDDLFAGMLGGDLDKEIDLEAISFDGARLWLCGSHCRVRREADNDTHLDARFRRRPSRHLFGSIPLDASGDLADGAAWTLPALGRGSLRRVLRQDPYLAPFLNLPSKEGGLDIEGLVVKKDRAFLGLRGPLIDSIAVIMEMSLSAELGEGVSISHRHFLRLDGLGVRGMALWEKDVLLIAGPLSDATAPFHLCRWRPKRVERIQEAEILFSWPQGGEKPEAICPMHNRDGAKGILILFDKPSAQRINGSHYRAEWRKLY